MNPKTQQTLQEQVTRFREQPSTPQKSVDMNKEAVYFGAAFRKVEPRFDPKLADKDILRSIFAWVWKNDEYNTLRLDYNKGLCFFGTLGLGKSITMRAMQQYMNYLKRRDFKDPRLGMWMLSASELANKFAIDGQPAIIPYSVDNLCVDELGREPLPASNYGTKMNVLQFLFQLRYDKRRTFFTHITTNLTMEEIAPKYGDYIADRFLEMFNFIEFKGKSLR